MTDSQASLSVGSIAIDPTDPKVVYVGTGEANYSVDDYPGIGILKTTDGGQTWSQLGAAQFSGLCIGKIVIDPSNASTILAAITSNRAIPPAQSLRANLGIWRSSDGGATWSQTLADPAGPNQYDAGTDLAFDRTQPGVVLAGLGNVFGLTTSTYVSIAGVYKSVDSGAYWTTSYGDVQGIPTGNAIQRVTLATSSRTLHYYAVLTDSDDRDGGPIIGRPHFGDLLNSAVYVSVDGANWTARQATTMATDSGRHQWWYDVTASVDPTDATGGTVLVGGVDLWQGVTDPNSGAITWSNLTNVNSTQPAGVHADLHALAYLSGTPASYLIGSDGGVWRATTNAGGVGFTNLNNKLNVTQFYGGSIGTRGSAAQLYGGTQDNGELQYPGTPSSTASWAQALGGDGGKTVVDYIDNSVVYEEMLAPAPGYSYVNKSTDGGQTWQAKSAGLNMCTSGCDDSNWVYPLIMSPSNHSELFVGTNRVYRSVDGANTWTPISPTLDPTACVPATLSNEMTCPLSALAVAPSNDSVVYAGDDRGNIYVTTNANAATPTWSGGPVTGSTGGIVTSIVVDFSNPNIVYATFSGFASSAGQHLFKSTNAGVTWSDISVSLPNISFQSVLVVPWKCQFCQRPLVVATDAGVFWSGDQGQTWYQFAGNLPNAAISDMFTDHSFTTLYVATHGRGMWRIPLINSSVGATVFTGSGAFLYAINANTGARLWRYLTPCTVGSPTLGGNGLVYFPACSTLYALNATTGAVVWSYVAGNSLAGNAPVLANGAVYVSANDGYVYALNATTGALSWKTSVGSVSQLVAGGALVFASGAPPYDGYVKALDAATGTLKWSDVFTNQSVGTPIYADGYVIVGKWRWSCTYTPCNSVSVLDAATGYSVWGVSLYIGVSAVAVANGIVYVAQGGSLQAYDENVGSLLWSYSVTTHGINAPPVAVGTNVYVTSDDGKLTAISTAGNTRSQLWQATAGTVQPTMPVIGDGWIFLGGGDNNAYAFDVTNGNLVWKSPLIGRTQLPPAFG